MADKHIPNLGTLCFIIKDHKILLGRKNYGEMAGKYVFPGGKMEYTDVNIFESIKREVFEETGLSITNPILVSQINFHQKNVESCSIYAFQSNQISGELIDTSELTNSWFDLDNIPFGQMWDSDKLWFYPSFDNQPNIINIFKDENRNVLQIVVDYQPIAIPNLQNKKSNQE
jgi:8-oxo-dGTP diphosphatase